MPPKKEEPKQDVFVEIIVVLATVFFLWLVWLRLEAYLEYINVGSYGSIWAAILAWLLSIRPYLIVIGTIITLAAIYGIFYNLRKIKEITERENKIFNPTIIADADAPSAAKNPKWDEIVRQINSLNPSDWRQAIISADVMLDEMLRAQGYHGDGVGEMLKAVDKSDFLTLDAAWDAHKVRNQIAHEGAGFDLTDREAKRVITEFESVFREFGVI